MFAISSRSFGGAGAHAASKAITDLTTQRYSRFGIHRGVLGKTMHVVRLIAQNPRGTVGRAAGPLVKATIWSFLGMQFFETVYNARRETPWDRYYRQQVAK